MRLISDEYIEHHGILGMKWGIRRFQNKDRTLTSAGKKRYKSESSSKISSTKVLDELNSVYTDHAEDLDRMEAASERFNDLGNELAKDYQKYYSSLKNNKQFKTQLFSKLYPELGIGCDDPDLFDLVKEEISEDLFRQNEPKVLKDKVKDFYKAGDEYFNTLENVSAPLIKKYQDVGINQVEFKARPGYNEPVESFVKTALTSSNLQWNAYMYRHFDDYWVNDVDERYNLLNGIKMDDYNKWAEKK